MAFIEKKSDLIYIFNIYVKPNARKQEISIDGDLLLISLKSKPENNRANKELIQLLKRKLKISSNQIQFSSGLKNQNKKLRVNFNYKTTLEGIYKLLLS